MNTYLIDRSPYGLLRANETQRNHETEYQQQQQLLRIPTGWRQPVGYLQVQLGCWTRDYQDQIQRVVRAGLEPEISGSQGKRP